MLVRYVYSLYIELIFLDNWFYSWFYHWFKSALKVVLIWFVNITGLCYGYFPLFTTHLLECQVTVHQYHQMFNADN